MRSLPWFRMWAEFATDPVVQSLAFDDQRHFVMLLCLKCSGVLDKEFGHPKIREDVIRKALGLDGVAFSEARTRLCGARLIDANWHPSSWDKRQFLSDHSAAERMRKFRLRNRDVTVTPSDTDTDTDTEAEKRRGSFAPPGLDWESFSKWEKYRAEIGKPLAPASMLAAQRKLVAFGSDQAAVVEQSIANGWHGLFHLRVERGASKAAWVPPKSIAELEAEEIARGRE